MSNSLSDADLRRIAKQNAANIEAIAKANGTERTLKAAPETDEAVTKALGFGGSDTEKSASETLAAQVERNAENLALLAESLGVSKRDVSGDATKYDTKAAADVLVGGDR